MKKTRQKNKQHKNKRRNKKLLKTQRKGKGLSAYQTLTGVTLPPFEDLRNMLLKYHIIEEDQTEQSKRIVEHLNKHNKNWGDLENEIDNVFANDELTFEQGKDELNSRERLHFILFNIRHVYDYIYEINLSDTAPVVSDVLCQKCISCLQQTPDIRLDCGHCMHKSCFDLLPLPKECKKCKKMVRAIFEFLITNTNENLGSYEEEYGKIPFDLLF